MKSELEKAEKALGVAVDALKSVSQGSCPGWLRTECYDAMEKVAAILNPPLEYEEVEESAGWVNIYPPASPKESVKMIITNGYETEELANQNAASHRIDCQEIKVKVRREKVRTVERSVTVAVTLRGDGVITAPCPTPIQPFMQHPDFHGCKGSLTFTTTDPPK
jgi:hypothetical protein